MKNFLVRSDDFNSIKFCDDVSVDKALDKSHFRGLDQ